MKVWILTYEINEYDQDGEYYRACFKDKPTENDLVYFVGDVATARHVLSVGGRISDEYKWWWLTKEVIG